MLSILKVTLFIAVAVFLQFIGFSQKKITHLTTGITPNSAKLTSQQGANIDVTYHRCIWRINPDSPSAADPIKYLRGNVTTHFTTQKSKVSSITFDFNKVHTIDSIKYHNTKLPTSNITWPTNNILQITFPTVIEKKGTLDSVSIYYQGTPPDPNGQAFGFQNGVIDSNNIVSTLSESYEDRDWWPCKHSMKDKIDAMDIIVSVPKAFWVAANGKMVDSSLNGSSRIFKFTNRYPIASYLVALGVAKYKRYYRTPVVINGTSVPVVYNICEGKADADYTAILSNLDKSRTLLTEYSNRFGEYPFKKEKHGYYEYTLGGMEHQTFSGLSTGDLFSYETMAHELAHQWFGDKVTCATWNDLWLNEGFATFCEIVANEAIPGNSNVSNFREGIKIQAMSNDSTPIYITDISSSNEIWTDANNNAIYNRGGMVISMLRTLLGDNKFFQACKNYLNDPSLAYDAATTSDLQTNMEPLFGSNLNAFFNSWIYGAGTPTYVINWVTTGNNIKITLKQSRNKKATVSHFAMPVVLRIVNKSGNKTTTLVLYDRGDAVFEAGNGIKKQFSRNTASFRLPFIPDTVTFDPDHLTMATGTVTKGASTASSRNTDTDDNIKIFPTLVKNELLVLQNDIDNNSKLRVINEDGLLVLEKNSITAAEKINVENYKLGFYIIQVFSNNKLIKSQKIVVQH